MFERSTIPPCSESPALISFPLAFQTRPPDDKNGVVIEDNRKSQALSSFFTRLHFPIRYQAWTGVRVDPGLRKGTDVPPLVKQSDSPNWGI